MLGSEHLGRDILERDTAARFSTDDWTACAEAGIFRLLLPGEYGGPGLTPSQYLSAMEELGLECTDNGLLMSIGAHILAVEIPLLKYGTESQRAAYLPGLASGDLIGAHAITESMAGSDALSLSTAAAREGGGYRLSGAKHYVMNAPYADLFIVYATFNKKLGFTGVSAFLVERSDPGVHIEEGPRKSGLRTAPWGSVSLDDVWVAATRRLGMEKQGASIFSTVMAWERSLILGPWIGTMERLIGGCVEYSHSRRQFGRRISDFQSVSNRLVEMRIRVEASRLLARQAAEALHAGNPSIYPEIAKLYISEAAVNTCLDAINVYGARGYTEELEVERVLRDALGTRISSGTSDIQRKVIAAKLGIQYSMELRSRDDN